jgi:regulator of protease activity HflC (stomatin/prohibitin superfamily)
MSTDLLLGIGVATLVALMLLSASIRIVNEYERGVIFRLGRTTDHSRPQR